MLYVSLQRMLIRKINDTIIFKALFLSERGLKCFLTSVPAVNNARVTRTQVFLKVYLKVNECGLQWYGEYI